MFWGFVSDVGQDGLGVDQAKKEHKDHRQDHFSKGQLLDRRQRRQRPVIHIPNFSTEQNQPSVLQSQVFVKE